MMRGAGLLAVCVALAVADNTIYEFNATDITEKDTSMDQYKFGLTATNYVQLEALFKKYERLGLSVAGFPCNQLGGLEPGSDAEILKYVQSTYNVTFDMFHKIDVNGANTIPLYKYLKQLLPGGFPGGTIQWNYTKFLINRFGVPVARYEPSEAPMVSSTVFKSFEDRILGELSQPVPSDTNGV